MLWIMETVLLERSLPSIKVMFAGGGLKGKPAENAQAETCKSLWCNALSRTGEETCNLDR